MPATEKNSDHRQLAVSSLQCNVLKIAVPPTPTFDHETLRARRRQMPNLGVTGPESDLDVVTEPRQTIHQLALEEIAEVAAHHVEHLGLGDAHAPRRVQLRQVGVSDKRPHVVCSSSRITRRNVASICSPVMT